MGSRLVLELADHLADVDNGTALRFLVGVCAHVLDDERELYAGDKTIAGWCGRSPSWAKRWREKLIATGVLVVIDPPGQGRPGRYHVNLAHFGAKSTSHSQGVRSDDAQPRTVDAQPRTRSTPNLAQHAVRQGFNEEKMRGVVDDREVDDAHGRRDGESAAQWLERTHREAAS